NSAIKAPESGCAALRPCMLLLVGVKDLFLSLLTLTLWARCAEVHAPPGKPFRPKDALDRDPVRRLAPRLLFLIAWSNQGPLGSRVTRLRGNGSQGRGAGGDASPSLSELKP